VERGTPENVRKEDRGDKTRETIVMTSRTKPVPETEVTWKETSVTGAGLGRRQR
jgi:hypothetical protein